MHGRTRQLLMLIGVVVSAALFVAIAGSSRARDWDGSRDVVSRLEVHGELQRQTEQVLVISDARDQSTGSYDVLGQCSVQDGPGSIEVLIPASGTTRDSLLSRSDRVRLGVTRCRLIGVGHGRVVWSRSLDEFHSGEYPADEPPFRITASVREPSSPRAVDVIGQQVVLTEDERACSFGP